jgi:hypothetical protein
MPFIFEMVFGAALLIIAGFLFVGIVSARQDHRFLGGAIPLISTIVSFLWIIAAFIWHGAFGPDYSKFRYIIIGINMFGMAAAAIIAATVRSQRSWPTVPAASILTCIWLYLGAINSVAG